MGRTIEEKSGSHFLLSIFKCRRRVGDRRRGTVSIVVHAPKDRMGRVSRRTSYFSSLEEGSGTDGPSPSLGV